MIRRALAFLVVVWVFAFAWFALFLPQPAGNERSDGIIVFTGGSPRVRHGLKLLETGVAPRLLISGVDPEVKPRELAAAYHVPAEVMTCCVTLDFKATETRSNAAESAKWVKERRLRSVRLITDDWHMRRSATELRYAVGEKIEIVEDSVPTHPSFGILLLEFHKFAARRLQLWFS